LFTTPRVTSSYTTLSANSVGALLASRELKKVIQAVAICVGSASTREADSPMIVATPTTAATSSAIRNLIMFMAQLLSCLVAVQCFITLLSRRALCAGCGAGACRAFSDPPQRPIRCALIADYLTTRRPLQ